MNLKGYVHKTVIDDSESKTLLDAAEAMFGPKWESEWCIKILRWPDGNAEVVGMDMNWNSPGG